MNEFKPNELYTHPQICRIKNEEILRGGSRLKQIKEWNKKEIWEKEGSKLKFIRNLTDDEIQVQELNKTYNELLELCIFSYLGNIKENKVTLTISKCAELMWLRNENYVYGRNNQDEILDLIADDKLIPINNEDITSYNLNTFFENNEHNYHRKIKMVLNNMQEMGLITYRRFLHLRYKRNGYSYSRFATEEEEKLLLDLGNEMISTFPDRQVVNEIDGTVEFVKANKSNLTKKENYKFYKIIPKKFVREINKTRKDDEYCEFYYYEYDIILSQEQINKHIPYKIDNIRRAINNKVKNSNIFESFKLWFIDKDTDVNIKKLISKNKKENEDV